MSSTWSILPRGEATDSSQPPECELCRDTGVWTGYLESKDRSTRQEWFNKPCPRDCKAGLAEKARRAQETIDVMFGQAQIHERWRNAAITDFGSIIQWRVRSRIDQGKGFYIWGGVGVGKTRLLAASLLDRMRAGHSGLYITVPSLLLRIKSTFREGSDATEQALLDQASTVDWLGLDDLGVDTPTEWARSELFQIVNTRYDLNKPIIATSNFDVEDLGRPEMYGERIVSRLREMCGKPISANGMDWRRRVE